MSVILAQEKNKQYIWSSRDFSTDLWHKPLSLTDKDSGVDTRQTADHIRIDDDRKYLSLSFPHSTVSLFRIKYLINAQQNIHYR